MKPGVPGAGQEALQHRLRLWGEGQARHHSSWAPCTGTECRGSLKAAVWGVLGSIFPGRSWGEKLQELIIKASEKMMLD